MEPGVGGSSPPSCTIFPKANLHPRAEVSRPVTDTVTRSEGNALVLKYKDGEKTIVVPENTPIVRAVPADKSELKAGAKIFIAAAIRSADGSLTAQRVTVGLNGLTPPM